ncbi:choline/carnitine O-acyltransferase [Kocuria sp. cx-455]|uniref:choline/carnitine O-acyltransferase n=1 Tax=Kocuria sp. cx-455 TaxID=2771377 RepID=UPI00168549F5|nr:choline/carnitine O-acyltransferase [Kocuria sp. cx-455]MBD2765836.1 choline/carnitine O-acyltransferase [Kocuria sp. cx-455]
MSAKPLPVPELDATLDRFLTTVRPLVDDAAYGETVEATESFRKQHGPDVQAGLEEFARDQNAAGNSWLSEDWLRGYLMTRTSLPLTSNVGFQITGDFGAPGLGRAAELVYRAAWVHLQQVRGETPQEVDPRGNDISMEQWRCLEGGLRHPAKEVDEIIRPELSAAEREIGVIHRGRLYAVRISDADGQPLSLRTVAESLRSVIDGAEATAEPEPPFGTLSYLGSEKAAPLLEELTENPHNADIYDRITRMIFMVNVLDAQAEVVEHLERSAFEVGHAWAYKPLTYEVCLADDWLAIHVEHSTVDGATILAAVARMQELAIPEEPVASEIADPEPLTWELRDSLRSTLLEELTAYRREAALHGVHRVFVPRPHKAELPFSISDDAAQQLIMLFAQWATYNRVRSVYEAVDMREYQAGRTECLRPVTSEAMEFVAALQAVEPTLEQFQAALDAHRGWIKACKSAHGIDRHLLGLQYVAERDGVDTSFFQNPGLKIMRRDFLSTTSIGGPEQIVRYAFAPTTPEGFGMTYTRLSDGYEFCINYRRDTSEDLEGFARNLTVGAEKLWEFVQTL